MTKMTFAIQFSILHQLSKPFNQTEQNIPQKIKATILYFPSEGVQSAPYRGKLMRQDFNELTSVQPYR